MPPKENTRQGLAASDRCMARRLGRVAGRRGEVGRAYGAKCERDDEKDLKAHRRRKSATSKGAWESEILNEDASIVTVKAPWMEYPHGMEMSIADGECLWLTC